MERNNRPNVVVFFTDQQRWDTTGVHGNPLDLTPNFDRMVNLGTHVHNMFTCQPVCAPARASLQTGLYATRTGVYQNSIALRKEEKTLAHYFKGAGYRTGYIGKWHLADDDPVAPDQQGGYDYWLGANVLEFTSTPYQTVLYDKDCQEVRLPGYRIDALTDAAIRYIDQHKEDPFFLTISYIEPHHQNHIDDYVAPDGYRERFTGRWLPPDLLALGGSSGQHIGGYFGLIKKLDEALGRILDALKSLGLADNTIVAYTSDHGCHFKTRNSEYKRSCHDSSIRVPTGFTGPGFTGGGRLQEMVSLVDIAPTLLDAAGIPVPDQMDGRSILPLIRKENVDWPEEVFVQISESGIARAVRTKRWKYCVECKDAKWPFASSSDHYTEAYLYDLESDPYELRNLIGYESHQKVAAVMRERLLRRMREAGEAEPEIVLAEPVESGQRRVTEEEAYM